MKKIFIISLVFLSFIGVVSPVIAQGYESPLSPLKTSSVIALDKTIQKPGTSSFVENLGTNDPKYAPGAEVPFKITVKNTGTTSLSNIQVTDTLPSFMVNNADLKPTAVFPIKTLGPGKSQTFNLSGRVANASSLPKDQRVICLVNQAAASTGNQTSNDNAQFCVENPNVTTQPTSAVTANGKDISGIPGGQNGTGTTKGGQNGGSTKGGLPIYGPSGVNTSPKTGPESLALASLFPTGLLGYLLRRKYA